MTSNLKLVPGFVWSFTHSSGLWGTNGLKRLKEMLYNHQRSLQKIHFSHKDKVFPGSKQLRHGSVFF